MGFFLPSEWQMFFKFPTRCCCYFKVLIEFTIGLGTDARSGWKDLLQFEFDRN